MEVKLNILAWRHCSKVIYRQYNNTDASIVRVVENDENHSAAEKDASFNIQTGHTAVTLEKAFMVNLFANLQTAPRPNGPC